MKKPCPFCGSTVLFYTFARHRDGEVVGWVLCNSCGANGPKANSKEEADEKWNERKGWKWPVAEDEAKGG